ncbi:hypothetical protein SDC9_148208 [bioreactor metagenome]|uniref:Uncharacterized protein n=1 Tax=bioreactor metagenome TaxID=1076179 RepID=A0A645EIN8_9ZZZZ|nr:hypothetical protein [Romboutsia lituseburensis]
MNKKIVFRVIAIIFMLSIFSKAVYAAPPSLRELKAYTEYNEIFNRIEDIRNNVTLIKVNQSTAKNSSNKIQREISFFVTQLNSIEIEIEKIKKEQYNSMPDQVCARELMIICDSLKMSIEQLVLLLDIIKADEPAGSDLFYSEYLFHSYYHLNLSDDVSAYVGRYYNFK